jgi:hypothetical protein
MATSVSEVGSKGEESEVSVRHAEFFMRRNWSDPQLRARVDQHRSHT